MNYTRLILSIFYLSLSCRPLTNSKIKEGLVEPMTYDSMHNAFTEEVFKSANPFVHPETKKTKDIDIVYRVYNPLKQKDLIKASPVATVIIHQGRRESMYHYESFVDKLVKKGIRVLLFDMRGQGQSTHLLENRYKGHVGNFQNYIEDLQQFTTLIKSKGYVHDNDPLYLYGHSTGGLIAAAYLFKTIPEQIPFKGVILSSPYLGQPIKVDIAKLLCNKPLSWANPNTPENAQFPKDYTFTHTSSKEEQLKIENIFKDHQEVQLHEPTCGWVIETSQAQNWLYSLLRKAVKNKEYSIAPKTPIMVLYGTEDEYLSIGYLSPFCQLINRLSQSNEPKCHLLEFPGARHALYLERDMKSANVHRSVMEHIFSFILDHS
ncbi:MAG: alpha/beta hydrolase [Bdellovibrionota bacterium]